MYVARVRRLIGRNAPASPPSCPALCRASTSLQRCVSQDVDGRDKPGHDAVYVARAAHYLSTVMPGHDAECVACTVHCLSFVMPALVAGIHVLAALLRPKTWMAGTSPAMTPSVCRARAPTHWPKRTTSPLSCPAMTETIRS